MIKQGRKSHKSNQHFSTRTSPHAVSAREGAIKIHKAEKVESLGNGRAAVATRATAGSRLPLPSHRSWPIKRLGPSEKSPSFPKSSRISKLAKHDMRLDINGWILRHRSYTRNSTTVKESWEVRKKPWLARHPSPDSNPSDPFLPIRTECLKVQTSAALLLR